MENIKATIERAKVQLNKCMESGAYEAAAIITAQELGLKMTVKGVEYGYHFADDNHKRYIFKLNLKKDGQSFTFKFGQSIISGSNEPTMYDVLTCLQKYDVGDYADFLNTFGYEYSKESKKIYKAVCKEFEAMQRLFTPEELELLQEIQ